MFEWIPIEFRAAGWSLLVVSSILAINYAKKNQADKKKFNMKMVKILIEKKPTCIQIYLIDLAADVYNDGQVDAAGQILAGFCHSYGVDTFVKNGHMLPKDLVRSTKKYI